MFIVVMFIAAAASVGAIGWSGEVLLLPVACAFPALWAFAPSRLVAGLVSMAYFMAASRGLPVGVSIFYATDMWLGLVLWVAASLSFVLVHTVLWTSRSAWRKAVRYAVATILMSVPPFGVLGWASPITAAGVLFPGWGWGGLAITATGLLILTSRSWPVAALAFGGAFGWSTVNWTSPSVPEGWMGINTSFDYVAGKHADYGQQLETARLVSESLATGNAKIVLPESALGVWTQTTEHFWKTRIGELDGVVLGGAIVVTPRGYDNVLVQIADGDARVLYRQRMPVPIAMWTPGQSGGAPAEFFGNPVVEIGDGSIVALICYEQLLVWPVLHSILFDPDWIVAIGNGWWTGDTNIVPIQKATVEAWAALFQKPLIISSNQP